MGLFSSLFRYNRAARQARQTKHGGLYGLQTVQTHPGPRSHLIARSERCLADDFTFTTRVDGGRDSRLGEAVTGGEPKMTAFAGFDRSDYPGKAAMDWLKANTNLKWTGFYLGPARSTRRTLRG